MARCAIGRALDLRSRVQLQASNRCTVTLGKIFTPMWLLASSNDDALRLSSCLIYAWALPAHPYSMQLSIVWVHSFIEPDSVDNNVLFDNTTLIYLISLL